MATAATIGAKLNLNTTAYTRGLLVAKAATKAFTSTTGLGFMGLGVAARSLVTNAIPALGAAFMTASTIAVGAIGAIGAGLGTLAWKTFLAHARVDELIIVNEQLAKVNHLSKEAVKGEAQAVQDLGIEAAVAQKTVAELIKVNLDFSKASDIARIAQDAAVIAGENSTETTARIIHGITTLNPIVLRHAGIIVDLRSAYKRYHEETGISVLELTTQEKQQIALNEVLKQGERLQGLYTEAMKSGSKQLRSMPRYLNEIAVAMGGQFDEVFTAAVFNVADFLKGLREASEEGGALEPIYKRIAEMFKAIFGLGGEGEFDWQAFADKALPVVDAVASKVEEFVELLRTVGWALQAKEFEQRVFRWKVVLTRLFEFLFGIDKEKALGWAHAIVEGLITVWRKAQQGTQQFIAYLQQNQGIVVGVLAVIIASFVVWAISAAAAAIATIAALWPVILVIALIGIAVGVLYQAWTQNWGNIQGKTADALQWIKDKWNEFIEWWKGFASGKLGTISEMFNNVLQLLIGLWERFKKQFNSLVELFHAAQEGEWYRFGEVLRDMWDRAWRAIEDVFKTAWDNIVLMFSGFGEEIRGIIEDTDWAEFGRNIMEGIRDGLYEGTQWVIEAVKAMSDAVIAIIKGFFGIKSPSKLMRDEIAKNLVLGMVDFDPFLNSAEFTRSFFSLGNMVNHLATQNVPERSGESMPITNYGTLNINYKEREKPDVLRMVRV